MKSRKPLAALVLAFAVSLALARFGSAAEPITFTIKFSVGQSDRQTATTESEYILSGGSLTAPKKLSQKTSSTTTLRQIKSDEAGTIAEMTYDAVKLSGSMFAHENPDVVDKAFSALVGKTVTLHFSPAGKVDKIEGVNAILADMPAGMIGAATRQYLSGDRLKDEFNSPIELFLPAKAVQIGETWKTEISNSYPEGTSTLNCDVTLVGVEDREGHKIAKVEFNAKGKVDPAAGAAKSHEKFKQFDQKGTAEFDLTRGWLIAHEFERRTVHEKTYTPAGKPPFTMLLEETLKSSFAITDGKQGGTAPVVAKPEAAK